jgi:hypothetical protein
MLATAVTIGCGMRRSSDSSAGEGVDVASHSAAAAVSTAYEPSATIQEIMDSIVDPAADDIWHASGSTVDKNGVHDLSPTTDAGWHEVRRRAIQLVEAGNLLAMPGRKVAHGAMTVEDPAPLDVERIQRRLEDQHGALVGFSATLRAVASQIVAATDKKDKAAMLELGGTLDGVCESCHQTFWYPAGDTPGSKK